MRWKNAELMTVTLADIRLPLVLVCFWKPKVRWAQSSPAQHIRSVRSQVVLDPKAAHPESHPPVQILHHLNLQVDEQGSPLLFDCQPSVNINCFVWARANLLTIKVWMFFITVIELSSLKGHVLIVCMRACSCVCLCVHVLVYTQCGFISDYSS